MTTDIAPTPDAGALNAQTQTTLDEVRGLRVTDIDSYTAAGLHVTSLRALTKRIEAFFDPHVRRAHEAWKGLTSERRTLVDPVEAEVARLGREMAAYVTEQERVARLAQEAAHRAAIEAERAASVAEAAAMETAGLGGDAAAVVEGLLTVDPVAVLPPQAAALPKLAGVSYRDEWRYEVTDERLVPRAYLMVNEPMVAKTVAATQGAVDIPGIRVFVLKVPVVRSRP
jgi:hypothetical protein